MGRASGNASSTVAVERRGGIDPRRLLSTANPVRTGSDVQASGTSAQERMHVGPPRTSDEYYEAAAQGRVGFHNPPQYRGTRPSLDDVNFIISGDCAYKVRTGAAYRGHIGLAPDPTTGKLQFIGVCTYGNVDGENANVVYRGDDVNAAIKKVNSQMQSKVRESKGSSRYLPESDDPADAKVSREEFDAAWLARDRALGGVPATS